MSKPVAIFGATGGIGEGCARTLHAEGKPVILLGRRQEKLDTLARETGVAQADTIVCDVTDRESLDRAVAAISERHGGLAGVIFSVAVPFANRLAHRTPWEAFATQIDSQLKALHQVATATMPLLKEAKGRLIVISTEFAVAPPPIKTAPYSAAKAAMTSYAQVIAQEWLRHDIRVHIVAPGMVRTELIGDMPDAFLDQVAAGMPEAMLTRVEDVTGIVSFCLTDAADTLYGTPIRVTRGAR